jgi:hypothetical protein
LDSSLKEIEVHINIDAGANLMNDFGQILKLTTIAVAIAIGLFAFTLINIDKLQEPEMLGCATVSMSSDVVYPKYYIPLEHLGLKIFQDNCKACHRLDQKLVGPALRNSYEARDSIWFVKMILNANGLIASGDTLATRLFNDYQQTSHPDFTRLSKNDLKDLIDYLKLEGKRDLVVD